MKAVKRNATTHERSFLRFVWTLWAAAVLFAFLWLQPFDMHRNAADVSSPAPVSHSAPPPSATPTASSAPSFAEVIQAVAYYCSSKSCAATPSQAQVRAAVADICRAGPCGARATVTATGSQPPALTAPTLPPGQPRQVVVSPTAQQILSAVATYCSAHYNCQGPPGPPAKPQPFVFHFTVPEELSRPSREVTVTCTYQTNTGYSCTSKEK